jgi:hypothetical protein
VFRGGPPRGKHSDEVRLERGVSCWEVGPFHSEH